MQEYIKEENGTQYILLEDLQHFMSREQVAQFCDWFSGQTGIITKDGKLGVYPSDVERFLQNKPVID